VDVDMTVIGAGPVGLYAAYYAGFRGMRTAIVDSLPEPGGQISALYPEKLIYDIAGFPQVRGRDLVSGLVDQAEKFGPEWLLGHSADGLEHLDGGRLRITTRQGAAVSTGALVIAGGIGTFSPRPLPAGAALLGRGLDYFVTAPDEYAGQDVLVVGGGDSAVDWALTLEPIAKSVTLVHRRPQFTALDCSRVVAALGFTANLGPLTRWGLRIVDRHVAVDSTMWTGIDGVYAAGDIADYPGKVRLISVGFGEAALAVNNAAVAGDPAASLFPGHSTETAA
jgi:ferredoxin/flavodoxin---NADP+ reductase